jgi:hypothetical protein
LPSKENNVQLNFASASHSKGTIASKYLLVVPRRTVSSHQFSHIFVASQPFGDCDDRAIAFWFLATGGDGNFFFMFP